MIRMNFEEDLKEIMLNELHALGYVSSEEDGLHTLLVRYLNIVRRLPPVVPWTISVSTELEKRKLPPDIREGLGLFLNRAKTGENLKPYISTRILDADFPDLMFYSWGIHHFHLGRSLDHRGFIERTDELLFAITEPETYTMYLIDVLLHLGSFTNQDLLRIIENNWPQVLDRYTLVGVTPSFNGLADDELRKLGNAGINVALQTPGGRVLAPMGGGITTAKTSVENTIEADRAKAIVRNLQQHLEGQAKKIEEHFESNFELLPNKLQLRLISFGQTIKVIEVNTGVVIFEGRL